MTTNSLPCEISRTVFRMTSSMGRPRIAPQASGLARCRTHSGLDATVFFFLFFVKEFWHRTCIVEIEAEGQ